MKTQRILFQTIIFSIIMLQSIAIFAQNNSLPYVIVDTGQEQCFDNNNQISFPGVNESFYGQDAQYNGNQPKYQDNGDGTVTDLVTGLMWQQSFDHNGDGEVNYDDNLTYDELIALVEGGVTFAGYDDWRLPSAFRKSTKCPS